jgi:hypothetical protein
MRNYLLAFSIALSIGHVGQADTIFNNFGSGNTYSTIFGLQVFYGLIDIYYVDAAAPFVVPATNDFTIDQIELPLDWEGYPGPQTVNIYVRPDNSGAPGNTILESFQVQIPENMPPTIIDLDSNTHPVLSAGQQYWLHVAPVNFGTSVRWMVRAGIQPPDYDPVFRITGTIVPEPSTLAMLFAALPLAYLAYWRRRS